jgi:hypothetical protein
MPSMASMMAGQTSGQTGNTDGRVGLGECLKAREPGIGRCRRANQQQIGSSGFEESCVIGWSRRQYGIEAVPLNALSPAEADAEAKQNSATSFCLRMWRH